MPPKPKKRRSIRQAASPIRTAGADDVTDPNDQTVERERQDVSTQEAPVGPRTEPNEPTSSQGVTGQASSPEQLRSSSISETAATSLPQVGPQRLESLHSRSISSTNARAARENVSHSQSGRQRFQPKSYVRRSKEEREAAEKAEAERQQARMAAETISAPAERGGLFGRGRSRGSAFMRTAREDRLGGRVATGHLGADLRPGHSVTSMRPRRGRNTSLLTSDHAHDATASRTVTEGSVQDSGVKAEKDKDGDVAMDGTRPKAVGVESKTKRGAGIRSKSGRKSGGEGRGRSPTVKKEPQIPEYPWSEDEELEKSRGRRVNIEEINLITDEETGDEESEEGPHIGHSRSRTHVHSQKSFKPIRLDRHQHVERAVGINTDASSMTSAELRRRAQEGRNAQGSLFLQSNEDLLSTKKPKARGKAKDVEFVRNERKWQGVYLDDESNDEGAQVKQEPQEDDVMVIDEPPAISGAVEPKSAEAPTSQAIEDAAMDEAETQRVAVSSPTQPQDERRPQPPELQRRQPKVKRYRPQKPVLQTDEDRQEWQRLLRNEEKMGETLSQLGGDFQSASQAQDPDGDLDMEASDEDADNPRSRNLFLFQFSPVLPLLLDIKSQKEIKPEPTNNDQASTSIQREHATPSLPQPPTKNATRKKTKPKSKPSAPKSTISTQTTSETPTALNEAPPPITAPLETYTPLSQPLPPGSFGLLRLHGSNRVTATWGNLTFDISRGADENMAQEIVVCDWSKVIVKREEWEMDTDPEPEAYGSTSGSKGFMEGGVVRGDEVPAKVEQRREWREEISCGSKVWAMGDVGGGKNGDGATFVAVPSWGAMFGV